MNEHDFKQQAAAIAKANGIAQDLAEQYLEIIGDTPELDDQGMVVVRNDAGSELARIILPEE